MKKLSFLFAMMLVASMVMAQKTVWITQNGTSNNADYKQITALDAANTIHAVQSGTWNGLTTHQKGSDNNIDLLQAGENNSATMTQRTNNVSTGPGGENKANITQSGKYNGATLTQEEDGPTLDFSRNTATTIQSGTGNAYVLNQGSGIERPKNNQYLTQSGISNGADINQTGYKNESEITQNGSWNSADLAQVGGALPGWDKSISSQPGNNNGLIINQSGNGILQDAVTYQNGSYNGTTIHQIGTGVQTIWSEQAGSNNGIVGTQTDL